MHFVVRSVQILVSTYPLSYSTTDWIVRETGHVFTRGRGISYIKILAQIQFAMRIRTHFYISVKTTFSVKCLVLYIAAEGQYAPLPTNNKRKWNLVGVGCGSASESGINCRYIFGLKISFGALLQCWYLGFTVTKRGS